VISCSLDNELHFPAWRGIIFLVVSSWLNLLSVVQLTGSLPDGKTIGAEGNTSVLVSKFRKFCGVIGGVVYIQSSLTSTLKEGERSESNLYRFTSEERTAVSYLIGDWIDVKASMNALEIRLTTYLCWQRDYYLIYRVIRKSLRDFRPLRYSSRDGHAEGEHVNRGRDTASFCPTLWVLDMSTFGDAADVNPVIKFLPHTLKHLAVASSDCLHDPSSQL
jgi:hypothetical protein